MQITVTFQRLFKVTDPCEKSLKQGAGTLISYHPGQFLIYSLNIVGYTIFYIHYTLKKYFRQNTIVNLIVQ